MRGCATKLWWGGFEMVDAAAVHLVYHHCQHQGVRALGVQTLQRAALGLCKPR